MTCTLACKKQQTKTNTNKQTNNNKKSDGDFARDYQVDYVKARFTVKVKLTVQERKPMV